MMQLGLYEWVYLITNIFWTYTIFKFMKVFFDTKKTSRSIEIISYIGYFIVISTVYLWINIPIVLMVSNLIALICLTYNYDSTIKNRIASAMFIYLVLMCVEIVVGLISGYFNFPIFATNNYSSSFGLIICRVLTFVVVLILNNFKNIKKGESVPSTSWICIVLIPASSLYLILILFQAKGLSVAQVLTGIVLLFLINFVTFYLYDVITAALSEKMQSLLTMEQNKYYDKQLETIKTSLQTTNAIKHDLKNHMLSIKSLIESGDSLESLNYVSKIINDTGAKHNYSSTGNTVIDSIINFKLQESEQKFIKADLDLKIPEKLDIPSFDMTIILGNLIDNAIKAASDVVGERYIKLMMKYDKGRLIIQTENPYVGEISEDNGVLLTTKVEKQNHGIGLQNIKKVIQKYDGILNIDYTGNIFTVSLMMYVD